MYCTIAEVKRAMEWSVTATTHDAILAEIVEDVASRIDSIVPHDTLYEESYTEHKDGGSDSVVLLRRPLQSVTSVHDDAAHDFDATSLVAATDYWIERPMLAIVRMKVGTFLPGRKSVQVIYVAGFETVPSYVRRQAVKMSVRRLKRRGNPELSSQSRRDTSLSFMTEEEEDKELRVVLAPLL